MLTPVRVALLALAAVAGLPAAARAHRLDVTAAVGPDAVRVVAGYEDEFPAQGAVVSLRDANGTEVAAGTADERGVCDRPRPAPGWYVLVVSDAGHRAELTLDVPAAEAEATAQTPRPNRWAMTAVGFAVIAGLAALARFAKRKAASSSSPPPQGPSP